MVVLGPEPEGGVEADPTPPVTAARHGIKGGHHRVLSCIAAFVVAERQRRRDRTERNRSGATVIVESVLRINGACRAAHPGAVQSRHPGGIKKYDACIVRTTTLPRQPLPP